MNESAGPILARASNPFATRFVRPGRVRYRFPPADAIAGIDGDDIVKRLRANHGGAIVGPHGSGKSTLLATLQPRLENAFADVVALRLHAPSRPGAINRAAHARRISAATGQNQSRLADQGLLVVDGAEQLGSLGWSRLRRRARRGGHVILATSHARLPGLITLYETKVDPAMVRSLTSWLLRDCEPGLVKLVHEQLSSRDLTTLTNVRDLWFELYDLVQPCLLPACDHRSGS